MSYQSVFHPALFETRVVIVSGGGSGIGRCTAHELAALGAHVVLLGRRREKLSAVAGEIEEDGGSASIHTLDIRDEDGVVEVVAAIVSAQGAVHGLVNNAGGQFPSPLEGISGKGFDSVVRTNLTGGFLLARETYTQTMKRTGGSIVNIVADMWGGMPGMGHSPQKLRWYLRLTSSHPCAQRFRWNHRDLKSGGASSVETRLRSATIR